MLQAVKSNSWYRHFKGTTYYVYGAGKNTETGEVLVSYIGVGAKPKRWFRPKTSFCSLASVNGVMVPRFTLFYKIPNEKSEAENSMSTSDCQE